MNKLSEQSWQGLVALSIVGTLGVLGGGLIVTGHAADGVGTIIGALATGLNAPTGIAAALRSAFSKGAAPDPQQPGPQGP